MTGYEVTGEDCSLSSLIQRGDSHTGASGGDVECERSMILLQAAGDANESDINLMAVVDDGLEVADALLGVEASVGIYQVIDVATDDGLPTNVVVPRAGSPSQVPAWVGRFAPRCPLGACSGRW